MNPEIERLMALEEGVKKIEETPHNETDVTDLEMAKYHSSLVKTMASKFAPKRQKKRQNDESDMKTEQTDKTDVYKRQVLQLFTTAWPAEHVFRPDSIPKSVI